MAAACASGISRRGSEPGATRDAAETENTARTAAWFDAHQNQPASLRVFLQRMPKGADLHSHLGGAVRNNFV